MGSCNYGKKKKIETNNIIKRKMKTNKQTIKRPKISEGNKLIQAAILKREDFFNAKHSYEMATQALSNAMKEMRVDSGLTAKDVGKIMGCSNTMLLDMEKGKVIYQPFLAQKFIDSIKDKEDV